MADLMGLLYRSDDHGTVELRRILPVAPADLWPELTDPERLAAWFAPVTGDLREGGDYRIAFEEDDDEPGSASWGRIEQCKRGRGLRLTWQSAEDEPAPSTVQVSLRAVDGGTRLVLVHSGLTHGEDVGHAAGWEVYLRDLAAHLEGTPAEEGDWFERWERHRAAYEATL